MGRRRIDRRWLRRLCALVGVRLVLRRSRGGEWRVSELPHPFVPGDVIGWGPTRAAALQHASRGIGGGRG